MAMTPFVHEKITVAVSCSYGRPVRRSAMPPRGRRPAVRRHTPCSRRRRRCRSRKFSHELVHDRPEAVLDVAVHGDTARLYASVTRKLLCDEARISP